MGEILLITFSSGLKSDVCRLEEVKLHFRTNIAFVTEYATVMIGMLDILDVVDIVYACLGKVVGVNDTTQSTEYMKLVAI